MNAADAPGDGQPPAELKNWQKALRAQAANRVAKAAAKARKMAGLRAGLARKNGNKGNDDTAGPQNENGKRGPSPTEDVSHYTRQQKRRILENSTALPDNKRNTHEDVGGTVEAELGSPESHIPVAISSPNRETGVESLSRRPSLTQPELESEGKVVDQSSPKQGKTFEECLPTELRLKIYESLVDQPCYIDLTERFRVVQFRGCGQQRIPSFLQVNFEMRKATLPYFEKLQGYQDLEGNDLNLYHNPETTVFISLYSGEFAMSRFHSSATPQQLSQIQTLAIRSTPCFHNPTTNNSMIDDSERSSPEEMRTTFLGRYPNLKRILFIEDNGILELTPRFSERSEQAMFWYVSERNVMGRYRQKAVNKVLVADYAKHFPDRQVPVAELVYIYKPFV